MGFDVVTAARQLGVDPNKVKVSADGSTYTVEANGVTKTYKASGEGENSVFTPEQTSSGSGTPATSGGTSGGITIDQSVWAQSMSTLQNSLQSGFFIGGSMSAMPAMPDGGGLFQAIQNLMNSINIQMPTIPTIQTPVAPTVADPANPGAQTPQQNAEAVKQQFIQEHHLVEGRGSGSALKGIYYADSDGNGRISDSEAASGECYVWNDADGEFVKYKKQTNGRYKVEGADASDDEYELVTSRESGDVMKGSFRKLAVSRMDTEQIREVESQSREVVNSIRSLDLSHLSDMCADSVNVEHSFANINSKNVMYVLDDFAKANNNTSLFDKLLEGYKNDDWWSRDRTGKKARVTGFKKLCEAMKGHAYELAGQIGDNSLKDVADNALRIISSSDDPNKCKTEIQKLYNAIKAKEPVLQGRE